MNKLRVGLVGKPFADWDGGVDFLTYIANALSRDKNIELFLFFPADDGGLRYRVESQSDLLGQIFNEIPGFVKYLLSKKEYPKSTSKFTQIDRRIKIVIYHNSLLGFLISLFNRKIQVIMPAIGSLGSRFPVRWVGYIWDFQHRYFPQFFNNDELKGRDKTFRQVLSDARAIITNSETVKKDIAKFYPRSEAQVFNLPFSPPLYPEWLIADNSIRKKYPLPRKFFMISNQFWVHKDHLTAFKAIANLSKQHPDVFLVCTGKMEEPRQENYINDLRKTLNDLNIEDKVIFLGFIPKDDQIQILRRAIALIQPTLYEGGPGGGAAYNAVALGVPVVASDIPVNLEIKDRIVSFFKTGSAEDLTRKIEELLNYNRASEGKEELIRKSEESTDKLSRKLIEIISFTMKDE